MTSIASTECSASGGMAAVYSATHLRNASRIAVKLLHPEMAVEPNIRRRFLREGYAANSVEHPGTVRILDDDTAEDGSVFLVMELLEGETLDHRWERSGHRLGAREVARLMYQVLDVLAAAHAKGIVHRDIKPENLFLTESGTLKVLDFGVARLIEGPVTATRPGGGIIGTPAFMAPEQVLGKVVDPQSDLYSVGATAFTLLSKRYVHDAENARGDDGRWSGLALPVRWRSCRPSCPPPSTAVVDRALRFDKSERWPDARTMRAALADAYRKAFDAPMPGAEDADEEKTRASRRRPDDQPRRGGSGRMSDRASSAVTVLTGATPVVTGIVAPVRRRVPDPAYPAVASARPGRHGGAADACRRSRVGDHRGELPRPPRPTPCRARRSRPRPLRPIARATRRRSGSRPATATSAASRSPVGPRRVAARPLGKPRRSRPPTPRRPPWRLPPRREPRPLARRAVPPFVVDPTTGKKKWKLECL